VEQVYEYIQTVGEALSCDLDNKHGLPSSASRTARKLAVRGVITRVLIKKNNRTLCLYRRLGL